MNGRPRILLVDDDRDIVRALSVRLKGAGYDTEAAYDGLTGVDAALADPPDVIVLDIRMPGMDGLSALAKLREQETTRPIPALILTANVVEKVRNEAMGLGAFCFLEKPCDPNDLLKAIGAAIGQKGRKAAAPAPKNGGQDMPSQKSVLLVDDNQDFLFSLTRRFQELGVDVIATGDGLDALMQAATQTPDLIILDIAMPGVNGLEICEKLTNNSATAAIPVIILTGKCNDQTKANCKRLGAHYVHKNLAYWDELKAVVCEYLDIGPAPAGKGPQEQAGSATSARGGTVPKVLVIDDDPHMTRALTVRLGALGLEVVEAPNASAGTYLAWTENPDLIITDQNMPEMSGEQLIVKLKNDEATKDIPVIVVTGQKVDGREDMFLKREIVGRRGAVAYLTKPVNFDDLVAVLRQYVRIPSLPSGKPARARG